MHDDTAIGGRHSRFPDTRRSVISNIGSHEPALRAPARELLVTAYWKPVYKYVRLKWNKSNEDAKDLTQAFFARALEKEFFRNYDPQKAAFRSYLRACLEAFVANESKAAHSLKRGGGAAALPLDFEKADAELFRHGISGVSVEEYFQKESLRSLFEISLDRLRAEFAESNPAAFRLFERYDLSPRDGKVTYQTLAVEFGISVAAVTNYLAAVRRRFRRILTDTGATLGIEV
jgi:RNA polymerase sigma factor (sigma-70 family)